jgi:hypothetical protein
MLTSEGVELDIIKRKVYLNVVEGDLCNENCKTKFCGSVC